MQLEKSVSSQTSRVRQTIVLCLAAWCALLFAPESSWSSEIIVFGDSLSDVGNAYAATGGKVPPAPYYGGRFSNGNLWVERLAPRLNAPTPTPSSQGGTDYAYAGAATGATPLGSQLGTPAGFSPFMTSDGKFIANVPSLPSQVASFIASLKGGTASAGTWAIVWAGANDFFDGQKDPTIPAKNVAAAVSALIGAGVKNFLVPNLPDLSKTPFGLSSSKATQQGLQALSVGFDKALRADLGPLTNAAGVRIHALDTFRLFQQIQANPAQFHLSNVTEEGILTGNPSAPGYLFWDGVHPTTAGHEILATQAARAPLATPEPGSLTLLVIGLLALLGFCSPGLRGFQRRVAGCPIPCAEVAIRPWLALLCLSLIILDVPKLIAEVPPAPWNTSGAPQTESMTVLEPPPPPVDPSRAVGPQPIETELLLGLPTEIRTQWAFLRGNNAALMLEGIVGVEPLPRRNDLFPLGLFGLGGRLRLALYNGERNACVLKPGMDVYGLFAGSAVGGPFEGADVELLWWHNCGQQNRFGFVLGADIGCLVFIASNFVGVLPQVSGIFGLHF